MRMIFFDGQKYEKAEDVPDLGSFECVGVEAGNVRTYNGFSSDVGKLPTYPDLGAGSMAMCLDNGDAYFYHAKTKTWNKQ